MTSASDITWIRTTAEMGYEHEQGATPEGEFLGHSSYRVDGRPGHRQATA